jgi:hypothetical protein
MMRWNKIVRVRRERLGGLDRMRPGRLVSPVILAHYASTLGFIAPSAKKGDDHDSSGFVIDGKTNCAMRSQKFRDWP